MTTLTRPRNGRLARLVERARRIQRKHGSAHLLYAVFKRAVSFPCVRHCTWLSAADLCHVVLPESTLTTHIPGSFVVRAAEFRDLPMLAEYYDDRQLVQRRFERGDLCLMTICGEQLGAAVWIAAGPNRISEDEDELRCIFRIPAGIGWSYDGKGTRLGAWGTLMAKLPGTLQDLGIRELVALIDCNNWKSINSHRSLGYRTIGVVAHGRVCGVGVTLCKRRMERWHCLPVDVGPVEVLQAGTWAAGKK